MQTFTFLIGSTNDFATVEDLYAAWMSGDRDFSAAHSVYNISISEGSHVEGCADLGDIAVLIGRGRAMASGWVLDDTVSCLLNA
jgi:hypothetical protein